MPLIVMTRRVGAFVAASRAGNYVAGVERAFAFVQVGEEVDRGFAVVASDNDVPRPRLGLQHGGTTF